MKPFNKWWINSSGSVENTYNFQDQKDQKSVY